MTLNSPVGDISSGNNSDRLEEIIHGIFEEQERLHLLKELNKKGLCTRDILSFIVNQADLRTCLKSFDQATTREAMKSKISDCRGMLKLKQEEKARTVKKYLEEAGGHGFKLRKKIKSIRKKLAPLRESRQRKNEKKILHLKKIIRELKMKYTARKEIDKEKFKPTMVPERLKEYTDLCVFKRPKDLPAKQDLTGPFICHPDIKLSRNEYKLLSRDPKFSTMRKCNKTDICVEVERSLCKHRYNQHGENVKFNKRKKQKNGLNMKHNTEKEVNSDSVSKEEKLEQLWQEESHRYTYDPFQQTLKFTDRRPTDYKLNTRVIMLKPLKDDEEFLCETRKRKFLDTLKLT